jgi:predicted dehydrogenase
MIEKVYVGVLGLGDRMKFIVKSLLGNYDFAEISSVYDPKITKENNPFDFLSSSEICEDPSEVINNEKIDWVFIGSPNHVHKSQIISALDKGKNVFSEKPVAISFKELKEIQDKFKEKGKSFLVSYPLRYSPHYKKVREILESGKIGDIVSFEFNETLNFNHGSFIMANWRRLEKLSGGHILEKCCHDFDVTNLLVKSLPSKIASFGGLNFFKPENSYLLDSVKLDWTGYGVKETSNPFTSDKDIIDNQVVILEYRNGVRATFHVNCSATLPERRIYICGTKGAIRTDVLKGILQLRILGSSETITIIDDFFKGGHGEGDGLLIDELVQAMKDKENSYSTLDDGIKSAVTALGAEKSRKKGIIVDLEPIWKEFRY